MKKLLLVLVVLAFGTAAQAELLSDPGFEGGAGCMAYGTGTPWVIATATGTAMAITSDVYDGTYAAKLQLTGTKTSNYAMLFEDIVVSSFDPSGYTLSVWAKDLTTLGTGPDTSVLQFKVEIRSTTGTLLRTDKTLFTLQRDGLWNLYTANILPGTLTLATTTKLRPCIVAQPNIAGQQPIIAIDDASLVAIPEPLTLALLGFGGLFLRRRK